VTPPADKARKLLALALRSESDKEAVSAFRRARKIAQDNELHDLLAESPAPVAAKVAESAARAAGAAQTAADRVKATAADPAVREVVKEVGTAARAVADMLGAFGKVARRRS
jgi:hypothetical protein